MSKSKCAFITGIAGQDGSYLAELLLKKGYRVVGLLRSRQTDASRIASLLSEIELVYGDVVDTTLMVKHIAVTQPDEIYHLAAKSFIPHSWSNPVTSGDTTALGVTSMLEALRVSAPKARFFQAASSEIFGNAPHSPQNEQTPCQPRTPYGVSKVYAYFMTANYRDRYGLYCCSGIMYNHESARRGADFVTRKITSAVARISVGLQDKLMLGDLRAVRDWGCSADYVEAMWLMLQQSRPEDFVIATGEARSVAELVEYAFSIAGLDWRKHVVVDEKFCRPVEHNILLGDPAKAFEKLGWRPTTSFEAMIKSMVESDIAIAKAELAGASVLAAVPVAA